MKDLNDKDTKQEVCNLYQRLNSATQCRLLSKGNQHYWYFKWAKVVIEIVEVYDIPNIHYKLAKEIVTDRHCSSAVYIEDDGYQTEKERAIKPLYFN